MKTFDYSYLSKVKKQVDAHRKNILNMDFEEYCNKLTIIEAPLIEWVFEIFNELLPNHDIYSRDDIHAYIFDQDRRCREIPDDIFGVIHDDNNFKITMWIDYDCDTTLCKYIVEHKKSGFFYRDALDLGSKYLKYAAITINLK